MAKGQRRAGPVQYITLPDGRKIPYAIPSHLPPDVAQHIIEQLKANPEAALEAFQNAQAIARDKDLTQKYLSIMNPQAQTPQQSAQQQQIFELLRSDPEFKEIFDVVQAEGPQAMMKYMDDGELMLKISKKLREAGLSPAGPQPAQGAAGEDAAESEEAKPAASTVDKGEPQNVFDAAKAGDTRKLGQFLAEGANINDKNTKGVPLLGLAVGFGQKAVVEMLIEKGADLEITDSQGNTALHYAAGYGRKEIAEVLVKAGAKLAATNNQQQTPMDAARTNGESVLVQFLTKHIQLQGRLQQRASERQKVPKPASAKKAASKDKAVEVVLDAQSLNDAEHSKKSAAEVEELLAKLGLQ